MQIYVCVKHVPDTAAPIKLAGTTGYDENNLKFIVNPYDEYALEEAVQLVEQNGGEVVVVTVGPPKAADTIRGALAMGADRAILVKAEAQFLDSGLTAQALRAAIERDGQADMIFAGKNAVDTEGFQTAYRLAAELALPVVSDVSQLTVSDGTALAQRELGGGTRQVLEMNLPCVIGATKGLNEPRYPKFPDIMKAKKKRTDTLKLAELGVDLDASQAKLTRLEAVPERSGAHMLKGVDLKAQVGELVRILKEEEKVI